MKNMTQIKQPISFNPMIMYRGVSANAVNMGSCTMIQFAVGGKLKNMVYEQTGGDRSRNLTLAEEIMCGIGAGTASAFIGSPLELVMIQQQKHSGKTLGQTVGRILENPVNVYRGWVGAAVREALWTCGYLAIPPVVRRELINTKPEYFPTNDHARIPAALLGGLFACYLTHPFDTIKTCMQGDISRVKYGTFSQTFSTIMGGSMGIRGFYRGATFRYARMVCAVFIMDFMGEKVGQLMYPAAFAGSP
mmetsp:Transcript_29421/g.68588  ORF Transcript_29421/g.68588 Transcript_29421/m.68588 type:complete len:248 (+) Transcript_29421:44-787(+)